MGKITAAGGLDTVISPYMLVFSSILGVLVSQGVVPGYSRVFLGVLGLFRGVSAHEAYLTVKDIRTSP